jgi:hypothetical protein
MANICPTLYGSDHRPYFNFDMITDRQFPCWHGPRSAIKPRSPVHTSRRCFCAVTRTKEDIYSYHLQSTNDIRDRHKVTYLKMSVSPTTFNPPPVTFLLTSLRNCTHLGDGVAQIYSMLIVAFRPNTLCPRKCVAHPYLKHAAARGHSLPFFHSRSSGPLSYNELTVKEETKLLALA